MKWTERGITASIVAPPEAIAAAISRLESEDAATLPFLAGAVRDALLAEARSFAYRKARPVVGEGERIVRQDFDICMGVPESSALFALMRAANTVLGQALARLKPRPLAQDLDLNDLVVQRYTQGSSGISPHRDHVRYVGIVALVPLAGTGRFLVCTSRSGVDAREAPAKPGDLILMRAPGLFGRTDRPFHALRDVSAERYGVGMRQDSTKLNRPP